jgi:hypothetical protein
MRRERIIHKSKEQKRRQSFKKYKFFRKIGFSLPVSGTYYGWKIGEEFIEGDPNSKIVAWFVPGRAYLKDGRIVNIGCFPF